MHMDTSEYSKSALDWDRVAQISKQCSANENEATTGRMVLMQTLGFFVQWTGHLVVVDA
jgi:hypothetical protein